MDKKEQRNQMPTLEDLKSPKAQEFLKKACSSFLKVVKNNQPKGIPNFKRFKRK